MMVPSTKLAEFIGCIRGKTSKYREANWEGFDVVLGRRVTVWAESEAAVIVEFRESS
jgi:hypothetical protein